MIKQDLFECPCCKKFLKPDLHEFGKHYQSCLKAHDELIQRQDKANQAAIKLNAAVEEYNRLMHEYGISTRATVVYEDNSSEGGSWYEIRVDC